MNDIIFKNIYILNKVGSLEARLLLVGRWRNRDSVKALKGKDAEGCNTPEGCILV